MARMVDGKIVLEVGDEHVIDTLYAVQERNAARAAEKKAREDQERPAA